MCYRKVDLPQPASPIRESGTTSSTVELLPPSLLSPAGITHTTVYTPPLPPPPVLSPWLPSHADCPPGCRSCAESSSLNPIQTADLRNILLPHTPTHSHTTACAAALVSLIRCTIRTRRIFIILKSYAFMGGLLEKSMIIVLKFIKFLEIESIQKYLCLLL